MSRGRMSVVIAGMAFGALLFTACGPKYPACDNDENCKEHGEYCVDKMCVECVMDNHCAGQGACMTCGPNNACVKPAGYAGDCCTANGDCQQGKCYKAGGLTGICAQCASEADCGAAFKCVGGNCVPKGECGAGMPDCPAGKTCVNNMCVVQECQLTPIYFDFDESAIRADARGTLNANYECVKEKGKAIQVEGHCDERGSDEYNLALGTRRAKAAQRFLLNLGAKKNQVSITSKGEEQPVCTGAYESCWSQNRRDEFRFR